MYNLDILEEAYKNYIHHLPELISEGIYQIDLNLLDHFDLLHFNRSEYRDTTMTRDFQMIESLDKITLINGDFVVWIRSENFDSSLTTYVLIALNESNNLKLELAFIASGVYNSSRIILRVLEKFLMEIQETELLLKDFKDI